MIKANSKNLLSKLSVRRVWNLLKIYTSFYLSKFTKQTIHWGQPFSLAIEPTTACNLRCPECPSGLRSFTRPTGHLEKKFFQQVIDEVHKDLLYLTFYFQGEPYLHPDFLEMVQYASHKKIYTATSTNAHYLNDKNAKKTVESGLDRLIISIDGTTQDTYKSYRVGGQLDKVIEGAKNMVKWKKALNSTTPHLIFQFLVVKPNEHQIEEVKQLASSIGMDEVIFKTAQVYDFKNGNELIPTIDQYSRYKKNSDGTWSIKNTLDNQCWKMWHSCVVTWDGKVVPCCFDKDADHIMGDLSAVSMKKIWASDAYKIFRTSILNSRSEIDICQNCSEGCEVNFNYDL
ncbi:MAG: SPASM domain-containing protein [Bacteroidetes bacterium]|nr:SPASM domain-containing protein [Bacteroidota bacterium]